MVHNSNHEDRGVMRTPHNGSIVQTTFGHGPGGKQESSSHHHNNNEEESREDSCSACGENKER